MIRQWMALTSAAGLGLISTWAFAAREELEFYVSVHIPTLQFYVIPSEPDWIHREQRLPWDVNTSTLGSLRRHFDVRHDSSAIEARLESFPYLTNGKDPNAHILLRVFFNGKLLSHDPVPQQVVTAEEARKGARVLLEIQPVEQSDGYKPGDYFGTVNLMFNAAAPQG
ncbi:CS1 type fimbrial major subunit [Pseudomonas sp. BW7P1]|uniref:CS1 type fimbrial major subunit n=1 Tax=Pseudomonas TaxID=286 RepID=UPI0021AD50B3|nr:CS1 type fimbrial major subunit [Pseudomonas sp. BW7P1]UWI60896.1 CS1 type fimbrial major subunit [Pseudomonas sp. BW7P1]